MIQDMRGTQFLFKTLSSSRTKCQEIQI